MSMSVESRGCQRCVLRDHIYTLRALPKPLSHPATRVRILSADSLWSVICLTTYYRLVTDALLTAGGP